MKGHNATGSESDVLPKPVPEHLSPVGPKKMRKFLKLATKAKLISFFKITFTGTTEAQCQFKNNGMLDIQPEGIYIIDSSTLISNQQLASILTLEDQDLDFYPRKAPGCLPSQVCLDITGGGIPVGNTDKAFTIPHTNIKHADMKAFVLAIQERVLMNSKPSTVVSTDLHLIWQLLANPAEVLGWWKYGLKTALTSYSRFDVKDVGSAGNHMAAFLLIRSESVTFVKSKLVDRVIESAQRLLDLGNERCPEAESPSTEPIFDASRVESILATPDPPSKKNWTKAFSKLKTELRLTFVEWKHEGQVAEECRSDLIRAKAEQVDLAAKLSQQEISMESLEQEKRDAVSGINRSRQDLLSKQAELDAATKEIHALNLELCATKEQLQMKSDFLARSLDLFILNLDGEDEECLRGAFKQAGVEQQLHALAECLKRKDKHSEKVSSLQHSLQVATEHVNTLKIDIEELTKEAARWKSKCEVGDWAYQIYSKGARTGDGLKRKANHVESCEAILQETLEKFKEQQAIWQEERVRIQRHEADRSDAFARLRAAVAEYVSIVEYLFEPCDSTVEIMYRVLAEAVELRIASLELPKDCLRDDHWILLWSDLPDRLRQIIPRMLFENRLQATNPEVVNMITGGLRNMHTAAMFSMQAWTLTRFCSDVPPIPTGLKGTVVERNKVLQDIQNDSMAKLGRLFQQIPSLLAETKAQDPHEGTVPGLRRLEWVLRESGWNVGKVLPFTPLDGRPVAPCFLDFDAELPESFCE